MDFEIFLSHHHTEASLAQEIREFLEGISREIKVKTYVKKEEPEADFRKWINESVKPASMFIFLYTDDSRELSWAAHELGLFIGTHSGEIEEGKNHNLPIVCIKSHDIVQMPITMSHIAPISATEEELRGLLQDLLVSGKYSNKIRLAKDALSPEKVLKEISEEAKKLSGMFRSQVHTQFFADRMIIKEICAVPLSEFKETISPDYHAELKIFNPESKSYKRYVLDFSKVIIEAPSTIRNNLRLPEDRCYWGDFVSIAEETRKDGPSDRFNLAREIITHASRNNHGGDAASMLLAEIERDRKIFQPVISRVEKQDRLPISYYILMLPDPRSIPNGITPENKVVESFAKDLKLVLLVRIARRFRWNILEPFIWEIILALNSKKEMGAIYQRLQSALADMEKEGEQSKLDDGNLAALDFPEEHRTDIVNLWLRYAELRPKLDQAIKDDDPKSVLEVLNEFQKMNRSFLATALEVYKRTMIEIPILDEAYINWKDRFFNDLQETKKTNVKKVEIPLTYPGERQKKRSSKTATDFIVELIAANKAGINVEKLAEKTGYTKNKIYGIVHRLKQQGKIRSKFHGVYVAV